MNKNLHDKELQKLQKQFGPFSGLIPVQLVGKLLAQAVYDDCITCGVCETNLEADCPVCGMCGWENPLVKFGFI